MSPTDGAAAEGAPTAPKRAPSYLQYNRSGNVLGWGIALVVLGQTSLIGAAFTAITHVPYEAADPQAHTSGMADHVPHHRPARLPGRAHGPGRWLQQPGGERRPGRVGNP